MTMVQGSAFEDFLTGELSSRGGSNPMPCCLLAATDIDFLSKNRTTGWKAVNRTMLLMLAIWISCSSAADAGCRVGTFRFSWGSDTSASMLVTQGSTCAINLRAGGGSAFGSIKISSRPAHGTAGASGSYSVAYRPKPGFTGSDSFAFTASGSGSREPNVGRSTTIQVNVTVQ
jgi:hypothetical protein